MKNILLALLLSVLARPLLAQGAPPHAGPDQPYTVEYYYKVQWGHQQEFQDLFLKNHYPLLKKVVESGRMLSVNDVVEHEGQRRRVLQLLGRLRLDRVSPDFDRDPGVENGLNGHAWLRT